MRGWRVRATLNQIRFRLRLIATYSCTRGRPCICRKNRCVFPTSATGLTGPTACKLWLRKYWIQRCWGNEVPTNASHNRTTWSLSPSSSTSFLQHTELDDANQNSAPHAPCFTFTWVKLVSQCSVRFHRRTASRWCISLCARAVAGYTI